MAGIAKTAREERLRYGETVFLLEPNVKRSRGTLRDLQLIRWIGFVRYGTADPRRIARRRRDLGDEDLRRCSSGPTSSCCGCATNCTSTPGRRPTCSTGPSNFASPSCAAIRPSAGPAAGRAVHARLLPPHRRASATSPTRFVAKAQSRDRLARLVTVLFGHRVEDGIRVGPAGIVATRRGLQTAPRRSDGHHAAGRSGEPLRQADRRRPRGRRSARERRAGCRRRCRRPRPAAISSRCWAIPARLGPLLRDLHDAGLLERFIPEFAHARGLLQFNQYHKYTVDEHCLRAVEFATELWSDTGPLGRVYRRLPQKHLLHLALLIHDLGKGHLEDHREVGAEDRRRRPARRLGLAAARDRDRCGSSSTSTC